MTPQQARHIQEISLIDIEPVISVLDLADPRPRPLIVGYDCDRVTFDVGLIERDGQLLFWFDTAQYPEGHFVDRARISQFVPNKRILWERSDYEFCLTLKFKGVRDMAFTPRVPTP